MLTIAVVDDEREHIERFKQLVARFFTEFSRYGTEYNIIEFSSDEQLLENYAPRYDVIFLDIDMGGISGMKAAKLIRKVDENTAIIFVTRMARYAVEGYSVAALDFIVKPLDYPSFTIKMKRALSRIQKNQAQKIQLNIDGEIHFIDVRDILYVEVLNHFVIWHTKKGDFRIWGSLKDATDQIDDPSAVFNEYSVLVCDFILLNELFLLFFFSFKCSALEIFLVIIGGWGYASNNCIYTWADEQTIRENYLKAYEIAVKEATCEIKYISDNNGTISTRTIRACTGIMTAFNAIGSTWTGGNKGLITDVLRGF